MPEYGPSPFSETSEEKMNSRKLSGVVALAVIVSIFGAAHLASAAVVDMFLKIEGTKQGTFKGDGAAATGRLPGSQFTYQESATTGAGAGKVAASAQPTGRRMHGTITIVREIDKASPMFAKAMNSGEVLSSVDIEFVHNGASANPEVYKTLHLSNAIITAIHPVGGGGTDRPVESITFVADTQDIVAKNKNGGKSAIDDWMAQK
jgi:type VI secretion system Hcp family effector